MELLTHFTEELLNDSHEISERQVVVSHETLNLVKLSQVSGVEVLVTKHTVNREVLHWPKLFLQQHTQVQ